LFAPVSKAPTSEQQLVFFTELVLFAFFSLSFSLFFKEAKMSGGVKAVRAGDEQEQKTNKR